MKNILIENQYQKFYLEKSLNEDNKMYNKVISEIRDGVVIIPAIYGGYLLENHKRMKEVSIEFPRGYQEPGEDPFQSAKREIKEELNIKEDSILNLKYIGYFNIDNAWIQQNIHVVLIQLKENYNIKINDNEGILSNKWIQKQDFQDLIKNNNIHDSMTLSAYQLLNL